jgi:hypothetical protein
MAAAKKSTARQKPTAQQRAQAKARAGGNNPIIVTNKGLKKLGKAALIAASFTPVGRVATGAIKASRTTGIAGFGASRTPAQSFGKYAQIDNVNSKIARKIGDKISGASSKKVQKKLNKYAKSDSKDSRVDPQFANHPGSLSLKGNKKVNDPKAKFPTARQSVRWRAAEDKAAAKANARGLKAAQGKSLAPKKYKADSEGRKQVKRFAAPLEKFNGKKTSMRMGAQAVDAGRSSMKIKPAVKNRSK